MNIEYGVLQPRIPGIHRGPMTREEAETWIREAEEDGFPAGVFVIATRAVSEWSPLNVGQ